MDNLDPARVAAWAAPDLGKTEYTDPVKIAGAENAVLR